MKRVRVCSDEHGGRVPERDDPVLAISRRVVLHSLRHRFVLKYKILRLKNEP